MERTKEQIELVKKLEKEFDKVYDYNGDEELISSCNAEYNLDNDDYILTDGMVNTHMDIGEVQSSDFTISPLIKSKNIIIQTTAVRGSTYIIILNSKNKKLDLRIDVSALNNEKYETIIKMKQKIMEERDSMDYYINEWRPKGGLIPNESYGNELIGRLL